MVSLVIHLSTRDPQAQFHTGHQDIRYFSSTIGVELSPTTTPTTTTAPTTNTARTRTHLLTIRQRFQHSAT
jgi:hypothetical protein